MWLKNTSAMLHIGTLLSEMCKPQNDMQHDHPTKSNLYTKNIGIAGHQWHKTQICEYVNNVSSLIRYKITNCGSLNANSRGERMWYHC